MNKLFENKVFLFAITILFFGAVSVIASTIGDSGFSGIQVDTYYSGNGNQGITKNLTIENSTGNEFLMQIEDGLIVGLNQIIPPITLTTEIVSYYSFDSPSGVVVEDKVGTYNGTINSSTMWNNGGLIGDSLQFNGTGYYFANIDGTSISDQDSDYYSISMWYYGNESGDSEYLFDERDGGASNLVVIFRTTEDKISTTIRAFGGENTLATTSNVTTKIGEWTHIVMTRSYDDIKLYVNGTIVGSATYGAGDLGHGTHDRFIFGEYAAFDQNHPLNGSIDEIGIWNRTLTPTEVEELYNSGSGFAYPFS